MFYRKDTEEKKWWTEKDFERHRFAGYKFKYNRLYNITGAARADILLFRAHDRTGTLYYPKGNRQTFRFSKRLIDVTASKAESRLNERRSAWRWALSGSKDASRLWLRNNKFQQSPDSYVIRHQTKRKAMSDYQCARASELSVRASANLKLITSKAVFPSARPMDFWLAGLKALSE